MIEFLTGLNPVVQALLATIFTWGVTALGAAGVFFAKEVNHKLMDVMLGFAAGVMIAASYWSLLAPSISLSEQLGFVVWLPPAIGFLSGGLALAAVDRILPHIHPEDPNEPAEGLKSQWRRSLLLILAVTIHNFPEGMAVGVAFGAAAAGLEGATIGGAVALAIGIGLQNFPEGMIISMPLRREGLSRFKSFWYGQLSAVVEPIAGVIGAAAVLHAMWILPFALAFAAGAMIFVVVEEIIPEAQSGHNADIASVGTMIGFALMMVLDVALG